VLDDLLLLLAVAPGAFLLLFFYMKDRYEREPVLLVLLCFIAGAASTLLAFILEVAAEPFFDLMPWTMGWLLVYTTLGVGLPEELSKLLAVRLTAFRHCAFNEPMDGIVYTVAAGMGFATIENVLYVTELGFGVGVLRAVLSVPMHALFAVVMGYYVGRAHRARAEGRSSGGLLLVGLLLATVIHGIFNFIIYAFQDNVLQLPLLFTYYGFVMLYGVFLVRRALAASPFNRKELAGRRV